MAIKFRNTGSKFSRHGGAQANIDGSRSAVEIMQYYVDNGESSIIVLQQPEIPVIGALHPDDPTMRLRDINCSDLQEGDGIKSGRYDVALTYQRVVNQSESTIPDRSISPWRRQAYNVSYREKEIIVPFQNSYNTSDPSGSPSLPVLNPAGDPYDATINQYNTILAFSYNVQSFNPDWIDRYRDTINASAVTILDTKIPAQRGRIVNLGAEYLTQEDGNGDIEYRYWKVNVEIETTKKSFTEEFLAQGLNFIYQPDGKKYRIYTDNKGGLGRKEDMGAGAVPVDTFVKLDSKGDIFTGTGAEYTKHTPSAIVSWSAFNFPSKITG